MKDEKVLSIDVEGVLRERLPRLCRFIPSGVFRWLERTICQEQLNGLLAANAGKEGAEFCRGVFDTLGVDYTVSHPERMPSAANRRVTFVSNHPLGALDGMILIDFVHRHFGGQVWFVVNDLLMHVTPLHTVFLPVNKHGSQSRESLCRLDEAFAGDDPIIIFPAGLVSRLRKETIGGKRHRIVSDLDWKKMFVNRCIRYRRDMVPVCFEGANSMRFYRTALWRKRLGIKFNIEQIYLPREIFNSRGKVFNLYIGRPVPWTEIDAGDASGFARLMRGMVYNLRAIDEGSQPAS
ncbi:glycerol acyltransferase [Muribaculaceae bacterium Isolate-013 (NCI)]|nr:glycerol acyltransferase [Muribaculaceae bacterium Isolate-013 (NCI)]